jgi:hypothetical protein
MSRKSGYRFSEKDMRQWKNLEHVAVQLKRDALDRMPQKRNSDQRCKTPTTRFAKLRRSDITVMM